MIHRKKWIPQETYGKKEQQFNILITKWALYLYSRILLAQNDDRLYKWDNGLFPIHIHAKFTSVMGLLENLMG